MAICCSECGESKPTRPSWWKCWCFRRNQAEENILFNTFVDDRGCWIWLGKLNPKGYAATSIRKSGKVFCGGHKVSFLVFNGQIPDAKDIHHTCNQRSCMNPMHLESTTHKQNVLTGTSPTAQNARKTHCHNGHELAGDNLIMDSNGRRCRLCKNLNSKRYYAKSQP